MTDEFRRLAEIATGQHGAVTTDQIRSAGITTGQLRGRVQSGILHPSGVHTYRDPFVERSVLGDLRELVVDCGADTFVSGPSAAALHGFDGISLRPPFHVTIVRGRNVQRVHHCIHTTTALPPIDQAEASGMAVMSPTRTLIDLGRFVSPSTLTAALDSALPRRPHDRGGVAPADHRAAQPGSLRDPEAAGRHRGQRGQPGRPQLARAPLPRAVRRRRPPAPGGPAGPGAGRRPPRARRLSLPRDQRRRRAARLPLAPHQGADGA